MSEGLTVEVQSVSELSSVERQDLELQETVIEEGALTFFRVGAALAAIRDRHLYRGTHATFEAYCQARWEFGRSQAYRLIDSAATIENLSPIGDIPKKESHVRPLVKLTPEQQRQAWQLVLNLDGPVTGDKVTQAAEQVQKSDSPQLSNPNSHDQHLTPPPVKTLLYGFFENGIDVDPCCNEGQPNIEARQHYRLEQDGLRPQWNGSVFVNPPYSGKHGSKMEDWALKLRQEFAVGRTTEAIALVPNYSAEGWWIHLDNYPVCTIRGRLTFADAEGQPQPSAARFASALFYLGPRYDRFKQFFGGLGRIWQPDLED